VGKQVVLNPIPPKKTGFRPKTLAEKGLEINNEPLKPSSGKQVECG
jgi:hypothetical protein